MILSVPLVFPVGSIAGDSQSLTVAIVDDAAIEGNEQFFLSVTDDSDTVQSVCGGDISMILVGLSKIP